MSKKLESFLADCRALGCADSTLAQYRRRLERTETVLQSAGKNLDTATVHDFIDLIRQMSKAGLASNTVAAAARTYKTFMKRMGIADYDMLEGPADKRTIFTCPNEKEMGKIIEYAAMPSERGGWERWSQNRLRDSALLAIAYASGCRVSELCRLQVEDLMVSPGRIRFKRVKGGREHIGFITPEALRVVADWLKSRPQPLQKIDWIFPSPVLPGRPISVHVVADLVDRCQQGSGIKRGRITPHTFRRAMITHTLNRMRGNGNGAALAYVAGLVGHTTWQTTLRYWCYTDGAVKEAHKRFPKRDEHGRLYYESFGPDQKDEAPIDLTTLGVIVQ